MNGKYKVYSNDGHLHEEVNYINGDKQKKVHYKKKWNTKKYNTKKLIKNHSYISYQIINLLIY